jgi:cytochrome c553
MQTNITAGKLLAQSGNNQGLVACATCHGAHGEGNTDMAAPRLAGLDAGYLGKQLEDFARKPSPAGVVMEPVARDYVKTPRIHSDPTVFTPGLRHDEIMSPIARSLSPLEIKNLSLYYASLAFSAKQIPADYQTLERGAELALRGKPEYALPACLSCHAPEGEGFGADFPPLAGQPVAYIVKQLDHWQHGQRDNDKLGLMRAVAEQLTDADKLNVATYYANRSLLVNQKQVAAK